MIRSSASSETFCRGMGKNSPPKNVRSSSRVHMEIGCRLPCSLRQECRRTSQKESISKSWPSRCKVCELRRITIMGVLGWILFGFVVGLIARAIMPGRDPIGLIGTTVLGIVGALLGGWIGHALGYYNQNEGAGFIAATIGAIAVLGIYHLVIGRRRFGKKVGHKPPTDKHDDSDWRNAGLVNVSTGLSGPLWR